jgi:hypothetical protein
VHLDGYVEVDAAYYAPPPGFIGRELHVQWDDRVVRLLDPSTGLLLREHLHARRGDRRIRPEDVPASSPPTTAKVLERAVRAGKHIGLVCQRIHEVDGEPGVRRIVGVLALARKHGVAAVDEACSAALDVGVPSYRFVKRYLTRPKAPTLKQTDSLIRQLSEYKDILERIIRRTA